MKNQSQFDKWLTIKYYRDFYDVPRIFLLDYDSQYLLFDCSFDTDIDEYSSWYKVFALPYLSEKELSSDWNNLYKKANFYLGKVYVSQVEFDSTHRGSINIDTSWFKELIANYRFP